MTTPPLRVERRVGQRFPYLLGGFPSRSCDLSGRRRLHTGSEFSGSFLLHRCSAQRRIRNRTDPADALRNHSGREHARPLPGRVLRIVGPQRQSIVARPWEASRRARLESRSVWKATNISPHPPNPRQDSARISGPHAGRPDDQASDHSAARPPVVGSGQ